MEVQDKHINLAKFLEFFKPEADTTSEKIAMSNEDFMKIASTLKLNRLLELLINRL
jgi:hypothetical protein|tara:strand:+ start:1208 stop:1375 length:168 start_codon:yes stop_codon:yes gene_type:complete